MTHPYQYNNMTGITIKIKEEELSVTSGGHNRDTKQQKHRGSWYHIYTTTTSNQISM